MKLSILIASLARRHILLDELLRNLITQVEEHSDIEVIVLRNNGEYSIGNYRQKLLDSAQGDYVCFIDDDDKIPPFYCEKIMESLGKDYVGFKVKLYNNEIERLPVYHSIQYTGWYQDEHGYYRGVTHLNPIRRKIALKGKFHTNGSGEDENWAREVRPYVKTENFIDEYMYFYLHNTFDSNFGGVDPKRDLLLKKKKYPLPEIKSKHLTLKESP